MRIKIIFSLIAVLMITGCGGSLYDEPETEMQSEVSDSVDNSEDEKDVVESESIEAVDETKDTISEDETEETNAEETNAEETRTETADDSPTEAESEGTQPETYLNNQYYGSWHLDLGELKDEYIGVFADYVIFYNYGLEFGWKFNYQLVEGSDSEIILTSFEIEEGKVLELDDIYRIQFEKGGEEIAYTIFEDNGVVQSEDVFTGIESIEIDIDYMYSVMKYEPLDSFNEDLTSFFNTELIEPFVYDTTYSEEYGYSFEGLFINDEFINFILYNEEGGIMGEYSAEFILYEQEDQLLFIPYDEFGLANLYKLEQIDETTLQTTMFKSFGDRIQYNETTQYKSDLTLLEHINQIFAPTKLDTFTDEEQAFFSSYFIGDWVSPYNEDPSDGDLLEISRVDITMAESGTGASSFARFEIVDIDMDKNSVTFRFFEEGWQDETRFEVIPSDKTLTLTYSQERETLVISDYNFGDVNIGWYFGYSKGLETNDFEFIRNQR